jgi:prophage antirepressor-like protein
MNGQLAMVTDNAWQTETEITGALSTHRWLDIDIRCVNTDDGEIWFFAADVCSALDIGNTTNALKRLDSDETGSYLSGRVEFNVISESGLYSLTMTSRKSEAKRFRGWVTKNVLPQIRRSGGYGAPALPTNFAEALRLAADQAETIARLEHQRVQDMPKVEFANRVAQSDDLLTIEEAAKILGTGRNRLFRWLRDNDYLMHGNSPRQRWLDRGMFEVVLYQFQDTNDYTRTASKTCVTAKGLVMLQGRLDDIKFGQPTAVGSARMLVEGVQASLF